MKTVPRISETEWEVMRVVWGKHPIAANEIIERLLAEDATWHPKTARTLLARLVQKEALAFESQGRVYVYQPLVTEQQCVAAASESFLDRVFGGSLKPMLVHLVARHRLTKNDLKDLHRLLDDRAGGGSEKPRRKR